MFADAAQRKGNALVSLCLTCGCSLLVCVKEVQRSKSLSIMSVQRCGSNNLTCLSDASALLQHIYYHGCPPQNHRCETLGISRRALLQSHSWEESSPHLARVFQRPRLAHDFTVHVNEAGNRTPNYSSGAHPPPSPETSHLPVHVKVCGAV